MHRFAAANQSHLLQFSKKKNLIFCFFNNRSVQGWNKVRSNPCGFPLQPDSGHVLRDLAAAAARACAMTQRQVLGNWPPPPAPVSSAARSALPAWPNPRCAVQGSAAQERRGVEQSTVNKDLLPPRWLAGRAAAAAQCHPAPRSSAPDPRAVGSCSGTASGFVRGGHRQPCRQMRTVPCCSSSGRHAGT